MTLEANPYARFLDSRPVTEILAATPATLVSLSQHLGPDQLQLPRAPGKWSPAQILCHLADCEIAFSFRLRQTLAEGNHVIQPFDQDKWSTPYTTISAAEALSTFTALRHWNLLLLPTALPIHANKPAFHPERGPMTFTTILETMAGHDLNHVQQLQAIAKMDS